MVRDPRASRLEDDPFERAQPTRQAPPSHAPTHVRVVVHTDPNQQFQPFLRGFMDFGDAYRVEHHHGSFFHFSTRELKDLALATGAFTLALALMRVGGVFGIMSLGIGPALLGIVLLAPIMLVAFAPAFIIHELGHKFAAKYYGCWAEFRADPSGLRFGVILALLLGIVFMAPGAVMVAGNVSRKQNGHIAIAGPLVNLALLLFGIGAGGVLFGVFGNNWLLGEVVFYWLAANSILGAFNMLPFGPLDGRKIKTWSEPVFWVTISIFAFAVYALFTGMQMGWVETIAGLIA